MELEREHTRVIRRLAIKAYQVANESDDKPSDVDLKILGFWWSAKAIYDEIIKLDEERYAAVPVLQVPPSVDATTYYNEAGEVREPDDRMPNMRASICNVD